MKSKKMMWGLGLLMLMILTVGCAPNNAMYVEKAAGFWAGLWHGLIIIITFIISLFTDSVTVYEANNTGGWYNFGFILGLMISLGHGHVKHQVHKNKCGKSDQEKEWEEIGVKVEEKVRTGIQNWLDEEEKEETSEDKEWKEIAKKVEEKIKRELKNWAEK